jgi:hypothetical protein
LPTGQWPRHFCKSATCTSNSAPSPAALIESRLQFGNFIEGAVALTLPVKPGFCAARQLLLHLLRTAFSPLNARLFRFKIDFEAVNRTLKPRRCVKPELAFYLVKNRLPGFVRVVARPSDELNRLLRVEAHGKLFGFEWVEQGPR